MQCQMVSVKLTVMVTLHLAIASSYCPRRSETGLRVCMLRCDFCLSWYLCKCAFEALGEVQAVTDVDKWCTGGSRQRVMQCCAQERLNTYRILRCKLGLIFEKRKLQLVYILQVLQGGPLFSIATVNHVPQQIKHSQD